MKETRRIAADTLRRINDPGPRFLPPAILTYVTAQGKRQRVHLKFDHLCYQLSLPDMEDCNNDYPDHWNNVRKLHK